MNDAWNRRCRRGSTCLRGGSIQHRFGRHRPKTLEEPRVLVWPLSLARRRRSPGSDAFAVVGLALARPPLPRRLARTLPPVVLAIWIAAHSPVKPGRPTSALASTGRWAGRLVWTGTTFAIGAFIATLVAFDLDRVGTPTSANRYFYGFLGLIVVSVALVALAGVVLMSAWICFSLDDACFSRAAVRALSSERSRDALPLWIPIWLDDSNQEPMPRLSAMPTTDRFVRMLMPTAVRGLILVAAFLLLVALNSLYPTVIDWIA